MKHLFTLVAGLMLANNANSMLINMDFGPVDSAIYTGKGILGNATDTFWNTVGSAGATNLTLADGSASTDGITVTFSSSWSNVGDLASNSLLGDRIISLPSQDETITISGLTPDSVFDIVLYNGFYAQQYSIAGQPGVGSASTTPDGDSPTTNLPQWMEGIEYARLSSVLSDGSGQLQILDLPIAGGLYGENSAIAGLQIQQISGGDSFPGGSSVVPVPPAVWLFGSGLLGLAGIARRRRKSI